MKQLMFVGSTSVEENSLREVLAPLSGHWEVTFSPDGDTGLKMLATSPANVVISNLQMPGVDGATFLKAVCERHPEIVRIILSSQGELAHALRAVPVAHQFLVKPCDIGSLRVAIERATSLSNVLGNKLLASIVGSVKDLPVLPRTYLALREKLMNPEASTRDVVRIVEQDVGISAKILQLVNSALFGVPREISSISAAVSYLGISTMQNLVLSADVFRIFEGAAAIPGFSMEKVHLHSQLTAHIASRIPAAANIHNAVSVAGMLHDVGKLLMAMKSPKHFARAISGAREERRPLFEVEEELMGVSHAEVGAYLLAIWGLPTLVVEAVAHHHRPQRVPQDQLDCVGVVYIANYLAHRHEAASQSPEDLLYQDLDPAYLAMLGINDKIEDWDASVEATSSIERSRTKG
ncbi:MAG TPA: response regulator [Candidatus Acidoferrum sp.]|nr:response regulator [Candidatus Acidoferrum sp.]